MFIILNVTECERLKLDKVSKARTMDRKDFYRCHGRVRTTDNSCVVTHCKYVFGDRLDVTKMDK